MIPQYEPPLRGLARLGYVMPKTRRPRHGARETTTQFLDRLCRIPDPLETRGEFERFTHSDLGSMSLDELRRESRRVRYRLDFEEQPSPWLLERLQTVRHAIAVRRRSPAQAQPSNHATRKSRILRTVPVEDLPPWH